MLCAFSKYTIYIISTKCYSDFIVLLNNTWRVKLINSIIIYRSEKVLLVWERASHFDNQF